MPLISRHHAHVSIIAFRLFQIAPNLIDLFPFKNQSNKDEGMKTHGLQVMNSIDGAITLLGNKDLQELEDNLTELGIVHNMKQVQLGSFAVSGYLFFACRHELYSTCHS